MDCREAGAQSRNGLGRGGASSSRAWWRSLIDGAVRLVLQQLVVRLDVNPGGSNWI